MFPDYLSASYGYGKTWPLSEEDVNRLKRNDARITRWINNDRPVEKNFDE